MTVYNYVRMGTPGGDSSIHDAPPEVTAGIEGWLETQQPPEAGSSVAWDVLSEPRLGLLVLRHAISSDDGPGLELLHAVAVPDRYLAEASEGEVYGFFESLYARPLSIALPKLLVALAGGSRQEQTVRVAEGFATDAHVEALGWQDFDEPRAPETVDASPAAEPAIAETVDEPLAPETVEASPAAETVDPPPTAETVDEPLAAETVDASPAAETVDPPPAVTSVAEPPAQHVEAASLPQTAPMPPRKPSRIAAGLALVLGAVLGVVLAHSPLVDEALSSFATSSSPAPYAQERLTRLERLVDGFERQELTTRSALSELERSHADAISQLRRELATLQARISATDAQETAPPVAESATGVQQTPQESEPVASARRPYRVVVLSARVRAGPSAKERTRGLLAQGRQVVVTDEQDAWLEIEPPPGFAAPTWIHRTLVEAVESTSGEAARAPATGNGSNRPG